MSKTFIFPAQPTVPGLSFWPPAPATLLQPNAAANARAEYGHLGEGVDRGTLRQNDDGSWSIARGGVWVDFDIGNSDDRADALGLYRWGFGSKFAVVDHHGDVEAWYDELKPAHPEWPTLAPDLESPPGSADGVKSDLYYDRALKGKVIQAHNDAQPPEEPPVVKPPTPPTLPIPPVKPTPDLPPQPPTDLPPQPPVVPPTPKPVPSAETRATAIELRARIAKGKPGKAQGSVMVVFGAAMLAKLESMIDEIETLP